MSRDVAVVVPSMASPVMAWWCRDCLPALASHPDYNVVVAAVGDAPPARRGVVVVPLDQIEGFIAHGHKPILVCVDGAPSPIRWVSQPYTQVAARVDTAPVPGAWTPEPVAPFDATFHAKGAFVWRNGGNPGVLVGVMARGAVVVTTVHDRWSALADGCSFHVNPKVEDVDSAVADLLADADECRRLTRLARERADGWTAERFVCSFEEAVRWA